jgi:hypothetical protein
MFYLFWAGSIRDKFCGGKVNPNKKQTEDYAALGVI